MFRVERCLLLGGSKCISKINLGQVSRLLYKGCLLFGRCTTYSRHSKACKCNGIILSDTSVALSCFKRVCCPIFTSCTLICSMQEEVPSSVSACKSIPTRMAACKGNSPPPYLATSNYQPCVASHVEVKTKPSKPHRTITHVNRYPPMIFSCTV